MDTPLLPTSSSCWSLARTGISSPNTKNYAGALFWRCADRSIGVLTDVARTSFTTLLGCQLSGLFQTQISTDLLSTVYAKASDSAGHSVEVYDIITPPLPLTSLKSTLDNMLIASVNTLTVVSAVSWATLHMIGPYLQKKCKEQERKWMGRIEQISPPPVSLELSRLQKINSWLEYPIATFFEAGRMAAFLRVLTKVGNSLNLVDNTNSVPFSGNREGLHLSGFLALDAANFTVEKVNYPISNLGLSAFFLIGLAAYALQAWNHFRDEYARKPDYTSETLDSPVIPIVIH